LHFLKQFKEINNVIPCRHRIAIFLGGRFLSFYVPSGQNSQCYTRKYWNILDVKVLWRITMLPEKWYKMSVCGNACYDDRVIFRVHTESAHLRPVRSWEKKIIADAFYFYLNIHKRKMAASNFHT
jgi:hypothetical protein